METFSGLADAQDPSAPGTELVSSDSRGLHRSACRSEDENEQGQEW